MIDTKVHVDPHLINDIWKTWEVSTVWRETSTSRPPSPGERPLEEKTEVLVYVPPPSSNDMTKW